MKALDCRIKQIKHLLFSIAEQNLWYIRIARFAGETGNFFIPTARGKSIISPIVFGKIMKNVSTGADLLMYYCDTTSEKCTLKQSREALRRLGAWLLDTIQVYMESPVHMKQSQLNCWIEAEKVAALVFSKQRKYLSLPEMELLSRYFTMEEILNYFKIKNTEMTRFLAECALEEIIYN